MRKPAIATIGYQAEARRFPRDARAARSISWSTCARSPDRTAANSSNTRSCDAPGRGFKYRHLKALGTPKPGRDAAKAGDRAGFRRNLLNSSAVRR